MKSVTRLFCMAVVLLTLIGCSHREMGNKPDESRQNVQETSDNADISPPPGVQVGPFLSQVRSIVFRIEERYPGTLDRVNDTSLTPIARVSRTGEVELKDGSKTQFVLRHRSPELLLRANASMMDLRVYLPFVEIAARMGFPDSNIAVADSRVRVYLRADLYCDIEPGSEKVQWSDGQTDTLSCPPVSIDGQVLVDHQDIGRLLSGGVNGDGLKHPLLRDSVVSYVYDEDEFAGVVILVGEGDRMSG